MVREGPRYSRRSRGRRVVDGPERVGITFQLLPIEIVPQVSRPVLRETDPEITSDPARHPVATASKCQIRVSGREVVCLELGGQQNQWDDGGIERIHAEAGAGRT